MSAELEEIRRLTLEDFAEFARLSGDDNPIHLDPEFSARTRFGRPVAHGLMLTAMLVGLARRRFGLGRLRHHAIQFPAPTFAQDAVAFSARAKDGAPASVDLIARRMCDGVETCRILAQFDHADWTPDPKPAAAPAMDDPSGLEGIFLGDEAACERAFTPDDLAAYADLTGDGRDWDDRLPEPLIGAMFSYLLGVRLPGPGTNYLKQETHFLRPVRVGETLRARVSVIRLRPSQRLLDLATSAVNAGGEMVATGRALVLFAPPEA